MRVIKKCCEFLDDCFFKRDGWDGLKVTGAVAFGAGAGVAAIVGAITLARGHAPEGRLTTGTKGDA